MIYDKSTSVGEFHVNRIKNTALFMWEIGGAVV